MTKKRKQKQGIHDQKIIAARHKNEFMARLKYYIDLWLGKGSFDMLPEVDKRVIYKMRYTSMRLAPAPGIALKAGLLDKMKSTLHAFMNITRYNTPAGDSISFYEFNIYYMTVHHGIGSLLQLEDSGMKELKERYHRFIAWDKDALKWANRNLDLISFILGNLYSTPDKKYYWFDIRDYFGSKEGAGNYKILEIHTQEPVVTEIEVNDDRRPAYKLGYPALHTGIKWFRVKPPDAGVIKWQKEYEVYIQAHALQRIMERIDCITESHVVMQIFFSLFDPDIIYENGRMLLAYDFESQSRIGYFVADVVEGKLLLRTFLFITNEGTPEARKLAEISGLCKLDVKYWKIDKLSTFLKSDIVLKPEIKKIFMDAGCGGLFNLSLEGPDIYSGKLHVADQMMRYLAIEEKGISSFK
jgi:hypothetical protein